MKKILLGAAAAAASLVGAGIANAETNAVVGIDYTNTDLDSFDSDSYGLSGAFNHDFANGWELQMDGRTGRVDVEGCCFAQNYSAIHYGKRTDQYSFGGFLGFQDIIYSGLEGGLEGQWNFSKASVGGSVAYADFSDIDLNATNVEINGKYFFTPNFAVNAAIAYTNLDESGDSVDWNTYGVGGEYRFANSPISLAVNYRNADLDGASADTWTIGLNFDLGTGSLQDRHTHGPSWDGAASMNRNFGMLLAGPFI